MYFHPLSPVVWAFSPDTCCLRTGTEARKESIHLCCQTLHLRSISLLLDFRRLTLTSICAVCYVMPASCVTISDAVSVEQVRLGFGAHMTTLTPVSRDAILKLSPICPHTQRPGAAAVTMTMILADSYSYSPARGLTVFNCSRLLSLAAKHVWGPPLHLHCPNDWILCFLCCHLPWSQGNNEVTINILFLFSTLITHFTNTMNNPTTFGGLFSKSAWMPLCFVLYYD